MEGIKIMTFEEDSSYEFEGDGNKFKHKGMSRC